MAFPLVRHHRDDGSRDLGDQGEHDGECEQGGEDSGPHCCFPLLVFRSTTIIVPGGAILKARNLEKGNLAGMQFRSPRNL